MKFKSAMDDGRKKRRTRMTSRCVRARS
jgi:hypothetical protein